MQLRTQLIKLSTILILFGTGTLTALAQTTPTAPAAQPSPTPQNVVVSQQFVDDAAKAFAEVVALRDALTRTLLVNRLSAEERTAVDNLIASLNTLISIKDKINSANEQLSGVYQKIIDVQTAMIDRLTKQLNKPRSAFQKFLAAAEKVLYLVAGAALGRGL